MSAELIRRMRPLFAATMLLLWVPAACAPPDSGAPGPEGGDGGLRWDAPAGSQEAGMGPAVERAPPDGGVVLGLVGPAGGSVVSPDMTVELVVPPGALDRDVMLWVIPVANAPAGHLGMAVDLGPDGTRFAVPVRLGLRYDERLLDGLSPTEIAIATAQGNRWDRTPALLLDQQAGQVHALISHLSIWALVPVPRDACLVDLRCGQRCCQAGAFSGSPARASCLAPKGSLNDFAECYAECVGMPSAVRFGSPCMRRCCQSAQGRPGPGDLCEVAGESREAFVACAAGCFASPEPLTVCPLDHARVGFCSDCPGGQGACSTAGAACALAGGDGGTSTGRCQLHGNGCGRCVPSCAAVETCGNDVDDDCSGGVDDGCESRACHGSAECASGDECQGGYCLSCAAGLAAASERICNNPGGACSFQWPDGTGPVAGRCQLYGRGCGECVQSCDPVEHCGNERDDDCNGVVDDGCAARACTESTHCPTGQQCAGGFCQACDTGPTSCSELGSLCASGGRCQAVGTGCGRCNTECASSETCGNDEDDDCDGIVDDGCAALACDDGHQCAPGYACRDGFCSWCQDLHDACSTPGGICHLGGAAGRCLAYGRGCGRCVAACAASESCGNDLDDDCNGTIDDGCQARACASSQSCGSGQHCQPPGF